jgi:hypothetical protein
VTAEPIYVRIKVNGITADNRRAYRAMRRAGIEPDAVAWFFAGALLALGEGDVSLSANRRPPDGINRRGREANMSEDGKRRASSLSPPEFFLLAQWGRQLEEAFGAMPYLVGSCAQGGKYRDVDVRLLLDPDAYDALIFPERPLQRVTLNTAISMWGRTVTGLPIDFQFQDREAANAEYEGMRDAIGVAPTTRWNQPQRT